VNKTNLNCAKTWLIFIFAFTYVLYDEILFTVGLNTGFSVYKLLFSLAFGALIFFVSMIPKNKKAAFYSGAVVALIYNTVYISQFVYWDIFATPYFINSLSGTGAAMEFFSVALNSFLSNWPVTIFFCLQIITVFTVFRMLFYSWEKPKKMIRRSLIVFLAFILSAFLVPSTFASGINQAGYYILYEHVAVPSAKTFGVLPSMLLDIKFNTFGISEEYSLPETPAETPAETLKPETEAAEEEVVIPEEEEIVYRQNIMDIAFDLEEENETLADMNAYFSMRTGTTQNEYTGMFEGKNLILITAEGFSSSLIDPEVTPTLYKLSTEGFVFENFYTPIWNVSTSDGEYVATTGLIPKSGVWSYTEIADNYMPFAFGNQFEKEGYPDTLAFHNHTYTYYNRDKSYPAMGYDYFAKGNGLDVEDVRPESDVEMMELSVPKYINEDSFHVYYLTVSGHLEYNYSGNTMAYRNRELAESYDLGFSPNVTAYIACQLELEKAMTYLLDELEKAGQLENTVIALSADHYPYGLTVEEYAELMGRESLDETFELYENGFILWSGDMEEPVYVDKYCSSLDIAPTLSNLFGLEYDSRLYMGSDIMAEDYPGLVVFMDRSYITDKFMYDASDGSVFPLTDEDIPSELVDAKTLEVAQMFKYSAAIIDNDYYSYIFEK